MTKTQFGFIGQFGDIIRVDEFIVVENRDKREFRTTQGEVVAWIKKDGTCGYSVAGIPVRTHQEKAQCNDASS